MMSQPYESSFDVAHGDRGVSRQLRESLLTIKSVTTDPDTRQQIDDVLAGKTSMRSFGTSESFARIVDGIPQQQLNRTLHMSDDELHRLADQGERELNRLREDPRSIPVSDEAAHAAPEPPTPATAPRPDSATIPGTRKPNREQIYTPDEPDDDDLYFQERRKYGWLQ